MFFYKDSGDEEMPVMGLGFSVSPSSLSFSQNGQILTFDVTVSGAGADNYTVSSDNPLFSVTPSNGGFSGGDVITIEVMFNGNDNSQVGTITFNSDNYGSIAVQIDSSEYSSGGLPPDSGPGGGSEPPPGP